MAFAAVLWLTERDAGRIRSLWGALDEAGIASEGRDPSAAPHLTFAIYNQLDDIAYFEGLVQEFAERTAPIDLELASFGHFPTDEGVVFLAPAPTRELVEAHRDFHDQFETSGYTSNSYYRPGAWVPHCTLAQGVAARDIAKVARLSREADVYGPVRLDRLSLVEFPPIHVIGTSALGRRSR